MSSREKILNSIRQAKPEEVLSETFTHFLPFGAQNLTALYRTSLESIGGKCVVVDSLEDINHFLKEAIKKDCQIVNGIRNTVGFNINEVESFGVEKLERVHTLVIKGSLGVAENGAVWVTDQNIGHRLLPFICEQLVLVLEETTIVSTMHEAYEQLDVDQMGYGVFIAGPSKTADIEQSLVIGAHGPINMQVYIIKNKIERP